MVTATLPTSDRAALLRTILEYPDDDAPRLVYADWLTENGGYDESPEFDWCNWPRIIRDDVWNKHQNGVAAIGSAMGEIIGFPSAKRGDKFGQFVTRRGFAEEVRMPCTQFMRDAKAIFESHPVTTVRITDQTAYQWTHAGCWIWCFAPTERHIIRGMIPKQLYPYCHAEYPTESAALDALSAACVAYGRSLAGLRPLDRP